jgi:hypothetical protein
MLVRVYTQGGEKSISILLGFGRVPAALPHGSKVAIEFVFPLTMIARLTALHGHSETISSAAFHKVGRNRITRTIDTTLEFMRRYLPPIYWVAVRVLAFCYTDTPARSRRQRKLLRWVAYSPQSGKPSLPQLPTDRSPTHPRTSVRRCYFPAYLFACGRRYRPIYLR